MATRITTPYLPDIEGRSYAMVCDSMRDMLDWLATKDRNLLSNYWPSDNTLKRMRDGDVSKVKYADDLLAAIAVETLAKDCLPTLLDGVAGGVPNVPAYLAGSPMNMRYRRKLEAPRPLKIIADTSTSVSVSAEGIAKRGVATLALVQKLVQNGHVIELYLADAGNVRVPATVSPKDRYVNAFMLVRVETTPLDLARLCWGLTAEEAQRQMAFTAACGMVPGAANDSIGWPSLKHGRWTEENSTQRLDVQRRVWAQLLGVDVNGVMVIPPIYGGSKADYPFLGTVKQAAQWVSDSYAEAVALTLQDVP